MKTTDPSDGRNPSRLRHMWLAALTCLTLSACGGGSGSAEPPPAPPPQPTASLPNILFIIMDDFGIDQLASFGYGGADIAAARTPALDTIAKAGVRFRNTWSMPTCSPTRATFFEGRYPFRTNVFNAILSLDLANSQVSPDEMTTPKLLKSKGYVNGLIGKMHLSGSDLNPDYNPLGHEVMRKLGWDSFEGYLDGAPYPIDTRAGLAHRAAGAHQCGFVANATVDRTNGADSGACYFADNTCETITRGGKITTPGRTCMERGGILDPKQSCQAAQPGYIDFATQNGYYTAEWILNKEDGSTALLPASDPGTRGYRSTMETDRAIQWIQRRSDDRPWMLSVGYSAIHTPLQLPPVSLISASTLGRDDNVICSPANNLEGIPGQITNLVDTRLITNLMIEAMDTEIGRLLVEAGLAARKDDGSLDYRPQDTNTMVVIVGDNGTFAPSVRLPFDMTRSKGSPYQSGVWVPLIVAGPMISQPDRDVESMVNTTDLFSLFAELADIDVHKAAPASRIVDAQPVLPYLTNPNQASIRTTNFTEMGTNLSVATQLPPPCVIPSINLCVQVMPQQEVCEDQSGTWYGPGGAAGVAGLSSCCAVNAYLEGQGQNAVDLLATSSRAIRNDDYKLVRQVRPECTGGMPSGSFLATYELYRINQHAPVPKLDRKDDNLLAQLPLSSAAQQQYDTLRTEMESLVASESPCPGDGNLDKIVDAKDLQGWQAYRDQTGGKSSWYDFNHDGKTDDADRQIIVLNMGRTCVGSVS